MNKTQWTSLFFFYSLYLLMGAFVFRFFETENEKNNVQKLLQLQSTLSYVVENINDTEYKNLLIQSITNLEGHIGKSLFLPQNFRTLIKTHVENLQRHRYQLPENHTVINTLEYLATINKNENDSTYIDIKTEKILDTLWNPEILGDVIFEQDGVWTMWNAFFFAFTVLSTIGYGHMAPRTANGQFFCIFFSIIGVPLNGILFAGLEGIFSSKIIRKIDNKRYESKWMLLIDSIQYLIPGLILFMLLPAVIFMSIEHWTYLESFYFAFITLTTIGFGDMVAGYSNSAGGDYLWLYRLGIQLWVIFGLGYFLMVITFIQKVLSSKEIRIFERKIRNTFKKKATVINDNLLKDLIKMREVIETISILKRRDSAATMEDDLTTRASVVSMDNTARTLSTSSDPNSNDNVFGPNEPDGDQNSLDIFMEIAETILHRTYSRSNSKSNEMFKSTADIGQVNLGFQNDEKDPEHSSRKVSIFRKLSTWSTHAIPSILKPNSRREDRLDENQETIHSESPEVIDSLGQLIGRVQDVILNDPISDRSKRDRAFSLATERQVDDFFHPHSNVHRKWSLHSNLSRALSQQENFVTKI